MGKTVSKVRRFEKRRNRDEEDMDGFLRSRQKREAATMFHFNSYDEYLEDLENWSDSPGENEQ